MTDNGGIFTVVKGHAPIISTVASAAMTGYLELAHSLLSNVALLFTILAAYWTYRKYKSESLKADAETRQLNLNNQAKELENQAKHHDLILKKSTASMLDIIVNHIGNKNDNQVNIDK